MRSKKIISCFTAAVTAIAGAASFVPFNVSADSCIGQSDFDDGIGFPWHICTTSPAEQVFSIKDGTYNVTIVNPGGEERGGDSRWDLQFRHKDIHIEAGHKYKVHWEVTASTDGEIYTRIGPSDYNVDGVWQNNSEEWGQGWNPVKIEKGKNSFDSEFTANRTAEIAEWAFHYGGAGLYQDVDCFPEGTTLNFDNMYLECETCGDEYISESETPCLWSPTQKWNNDDIYGIITPRSDVRINQLGYYNNSVKKATYATAEEKQPVTFKVLDKDGKTVYEGTGEKTGFDEDCGEYCQILDFSEVTESGEYTIVVDDEENVYTDKLNGKTYKKYISPEFKIGDDIYEGVLTDALNYYYQDRSGKDIEERYITSGDKGKLAHRGGHYTDTAYVQSRWKRTYGAVFDGDTKVRIDVTGGWYDAENHCKSVVSGANAVWLMQNMYERSVAKGTDGKWKDGNTMLIPENSSDGNGFPDILDEARYELEFMFRMMVDPEKDSIWGEDCADMVYHEVRDSRYTDIAITPYDYEKIYRTTRIVKPPTYAATFNMIACAAQASRLWKGIDDEFAEKCLENAEKAWEAVYNKRSKWWGIKSDWTKDSQFAPDEYYTGSNSYENVMADDEAYWAACELYCTTGRIKYSTYLKDYRMDSSVGYCKAFGVPVSIWSGTESGSFASFNNGNTAALGTLSLYLSDRISAEERKTIKNSIEKAAKVYTERENNSKNSMGIPYKPVQFIQQISIPTDPVNGYEYDSNGFVVNNAVIMAYAYDITGDTDYLNGVSQAMDYIFGRNGLGISYVTGYGSRHINNPCHRYWINEGDRSYPMAPSGVMAGGAAVLLADAYVGGLGMSYYKNIPSQKCYADSVEAWFENTPSLEMQAALAWDISFLEDEAGKQDIITTTSSTTTTATVTTTTTAVLKYGDANCDGEVDMADVVMIMQSIANPNKYGINGTADSHLTEQGKINGDMNGDGLTVGDAQAIQKILLGLDEAVGN